MVFVDVRHGERHSLELFGLCTHLGLHVVSSHVEEGEVCGETRSFERQYVRSIPGILRPQPLKMRLQQARRETWTVQRLSRQTVFLIETQPQQVFWNNTQHTALCMARFHSKNIKFHVKFLIQSPVPPFHRVKRVLARQRLVVLCDAE